MPLILVDGEKITLIHNRPELLTAEQRAEGHEVTEGDLVPPIPPEGMRPIPYWRNNQIEWEYVEAEEDEQTLMQAVKFAARTSVVDKVITDSLNDHELVAVSALFPYLRADRSVKAGEVYRHNGGLVEIISDHTTQQDWIDAMDASLYKDHRPAGEVSEWVQPTGGHDAYNIDEKVSYTGKIWNSEIDANTTVPGSDDRWWTEVV